MVKYTAALTADCYGKWSARFPDFNSAYIDSVEIPAEMLDDSVHLQKLLKTYLQNVAIQWTSTGREHPDPTFKQFQYYEPPHSTEPIYIEVDDGRLSCSRCKGTGIVPVRRSTRQSKPPRRYADETFLPGSNNGHTAGRIIDTWDRKY